MSNPRNIVPKLSLAVAILDALGTVAVAEKHVDPAFANIFRQH